MTDMMTATCEIPATATQFEILVSLAAALGAGCEPCAERIVQLAIRGDVPKAAIERTLAVADRLRQIDCFTDRVGRRVVARMTRAVQSAERSLADSTVAEHPVMLAPPCHSAKRSGSP